MARWQRARFSLPFRPTQGEDRVAMTPTMVCGYANAHHFSSTLSASKPEMTSNSSRVSVVPSRRSFPRASVHNRLILPSPSSACGLRLRSICHILSQSIVVFSEGSGMMKTGFRVRSRTLTATLPRKVCLKNPFP